VDKKGSIDEIFKAGLKVIATTALAQVAAGRNPNK
jgi:hypothetical protein